MTKWFRRVDTLLLIGAALFVLLFVAPKLAGISPVRVLSGSMAPKIREGDMAYIRNCREEDVRTGDVIAFESGNGQMVLHRVMRKTEAGFITKGDTNGKEDFQPASFDSLVGIFVTRLPKGAFLYERIASKETGSILFLYGTVRMVYAFFLEFFRRVSG